MNTTAMLDGKVAFITGAASGIGESTARRFAGEGARVVLADLKRAELERVQRDIEKESGQAASVECDVTDAASAQAALAGAMERWKRLDVVFANAGIPGVWAPLEEL